MGNKLDYSIRIKEVNNEKSELIEFTNVNFSGGLGIFNTHYVYPEIDEQEKYNRPAGKVVDIQGTQAHEGHDSLIPEGKKFSLDIDECPYLHIAIKAEEGTSTCLILYVRDKEPLERVRRYESIDRCPAF